MISREEERRQEQRRRRILASLLSLLLLLVLLIAWCGTQSSGQQGALAPITTATVQVAIGPTTSPDGQPGQTGSTGATSLGSLANRPPPLLQEVLGQTEGPTATPAPKPIEVQLGDGSNPPPPPADTPTPTPGVGPTPTPGGPTPTPTATPDRGIKPAILSMNLVLPGAYGTGAVRISNTGGDAFHFSVSLTTAGDGAFASMLKLRITIATGPFCTYAGGPPAGDDFLLPSSPILYNGSFASGNKLGDPAIENATGDQQLGPGQSELLCLELFFPWSADNGFQKLSANGTFTFTAKSP